jgi:peptidoglycan/LPS O-acetylase OafA/YrhL
MWLAYAWNCGVPWLHGHSLRSLPSLLRRILVPLLVGLLFVFLLQETILQWLPPLLAHLYLVAWCAGSILALLRSPLAARLGRVPLVIDIAAASYGIYLLHQPLLAYANLALSPSLSPPSRFMLLLFGLGFVCYKAAVGLNLLVYSISHRVSHYWQ